MPLKHFDKNGPCKILWAYSILLVLGWLSYAHTLDVPFYFDDFPNIVDNASIHLDGLTSSAIHRAVCESPLPNRPLAYLTFAINFYFGGYQVAGYHLVNILMHLGTGVLLFWLMRATLEQAAPKCSLQDSAALLMVMIWLVHPLQTQAVTYIVQRMTVMAGFFYLAALCLYVRGRRAAMPGGRCIYWSAGALAWGCALASKETALTLPAAVWLYEWAFFQGGEANWLRRSLGPVALGFLAMVLVGLVYTDFNPLRSIAASYGNRDFSFWQRLLTQPRVVLFYVTLLFWPLPGRLSLLHEVDLSRGWLTPPATLPAFAVIAASLVFGFWLMRKDRFIAFALFWFLGQLVIESSVVGLEMIYEHRLYLPTMFAGLVLYRLLSLSVGRWGTRPVVLIMGAFCVILALWTVDRNQMWRDPVGFWIDTVEKAPDSARAHSNLAAELMRRNDFKGAAAQLEKALALDEKYIFAHLNLAEAQSHLGDDRAALEHYQRALDLTGQAPEVLLQMGAFEVRHERYDAAERTLRRGLAGQPDHPGLLNQLGRVYLAQHRINEARACFKKAIAADPGFFEAYDNLGQALFAQGRSEEAIANFLTAVRIAPSNPSARFNLGYAYERTGRFKEAGIQYEQVLRIDPNDADVLYRTGFLLVGKLDRVADGVRLLQRALNTAPADPRVETAREVLARPDGRGQPYNF